MKAHGSEPPLLDIDAVLMDTWLLVVQLRLGSQVEHADDLWLACAAQVEDCRQSMERSGLSQRSVQLIGYAQCALIDEAVLGNALKGAQASWAARPLQAHFFKRHEGGLQVYEDLRAVLADPTADPCVLRCYQRLLLLGFRGCYPCDPSPEREQLLVQLNARVPPLDLAQAPVQVAAKGLQHWHGWTSPLIHGGGIGLLLAGLWWALHNNLANAIAGLTLTPV